MLTIRRPSFGPSGSVPHQPLYPAVTLVNIKLIAELFYLDSKTLFTKRKTQQLGRGRLRILLAQLIC
ncbi:hypothetical protein VTJ04DRAFT_7830 [Mycothermus thermophilus]|uniref:uncharacterized protein n=1 Tax=Humicola insolens TaxID=85995 RepID=UPI0037423064